MNFFELYSKCFELHNYGCGHCGGGGGGGGGSSGCGHCGGSGHCGCGGGGCCDCGGGGGCGVYTEISGTDSVALRGSVVLYQVSDLSDRDLHQAEQPKHYSSTNDDDESEYDGGYAAASTVPFGPDAGPRSHYGAVMTALAYQFVTELPTSSAPSCTASTSESLRVIWPTLCSLSPPE